MSTPLSGEDTLRIVIDMALEKPERGVPALIGQTQYGKTRWLWDYLIAKGIPGQNIMMINPQNDLPEDIAGWPYREGGNLLFTQPANIRPDLLAPSNYDAQGNPKQKWAIVIDELDKAQESVLSCFLTLFNPDERRLRHTRIPASVPILVAMNEPEGRALPDPLIARLLFLAFPMPGLNISARPQMAPIQHIAAELFDVMPTVQFPARPKAPGSAHRLASFVGDTRFWQFPEVKETVVRGLFSEALCKVVLAKLENRIPNPSKEWALAVSPQDMAVHLIGVLTAGTWQEKSEVLQTLIDRAANQDPTGELTTLLVSFFELPEALYGTGRDAEHMRAAQKAYMDKIQTFVTEQKASGKKGARVGTSTKD